MCRGRGKRKEEEVTKRMKREIKLATLFHPSRDTKFDGTFSARIKSKKNVSTRYSFKKAVK